jgi:hypothetical protein
MPESKTIGVSNDEYAGAAVAGFQTVLLLPSCAGYRYLPL